ncbi:glutamate receptor 4-like [Panulirus ornatus]|uniref:glutamate receptor 4-like n=1 Tax=Panulirus ornatus TaxID=150431 RepID=UPI003A86D9FD
MARGRALKPTSADDRAQFVLMWVEGVSARDIAVETGASVSTVYRWIRRWQRDGSISTRRRRCVSRMITQIKVPRNTRATNSPLPNTSMDTCRKTNTYPGGSPRKKEEYLTHAYTANMYQRKMNYDLRYGIGYTDAILNSRRSTPVTEARDSLPVAPWGPTTTVVRKMTLVVVKALLLTLTVSVILAVAHLPLPQGERETLMLGGGAVGAVLARVWRYHCSLILFTDGTTSATAVFTELGWLQAPGGNALFEVAPWSENLNLTKEHLSQMIAMARRLRQVSWCATVVVVSDDPAFLAALAKWSLKGRLLTWSHKLLVVTRRPLQDVLHLHTSFSMMNAMLIIIEAAGAFHRCKIYSHLPYNPSEDHVDRVASWSNISGLTLATHLPLFPEKFLKFAYKPTLKVTAAEFPPHVIKDPTWRPGQPESFAGPLANVLDLLAQSCNFSYTFVRPPDGTWGTKRGNGNWSGMVGMVHRKEVDLGLGPFGVSATRAEVVDYVWAIISDSLRIMASRGIPEVDPWSFLVPLRPLVWGFVLVALTVVLAILLLMAVYSPSEIRSRGQRAWEDLFLYIRVTLRQDMPLPVEQSWERLMLGGWMIMTIVLTRSYAGALMSMLAIRNIAQPFQTLRDVLDDPSITMVWQANTVYLQFMWAAKSGIFRDILDTEKDGRLMYVTTTEYLGVMETLLTKGRHVLMMEDLTRRVLMADYFTLTGQCDFYMSRERFLYIYLSMIGQKDHPLVPVLSKRSKMVSEAGLYNYWMKHLSSNSSRCLRSPSQITIRSALSFMNIWGMFVVLAGGHTIALIAFCLELLSNRLLQSTRSSLCGLVGD